MRAFLVLLGTVTVPYALLAAMQSLTGDPLSAIVLVLLMLITIGAWFAGPTAASGPTARRSRGIQ